MTLSRKEARKLIKDFSLIDLQILDGIIKDVPSFIPANADDLLLIGEPYKKEGIFLGRWTPKDRSNRSLKKTFNLFAAPKAIDGVATYVHTLEKIAKLDDFHGFKGLKFKDAKDLYKMIKNDEYNGEWFLPTRVMLVRSKKLHGYEITMPDGSIYENRKRGSLKAIFNTGEKRPHHASKLWSCTKNTACLSESTVCAIEPKGGYESWMNIERVAQSAMLVRAVPIAA